MVKFGVNDQGGAAKVLNFIDISETPFFFKAQSFRIDPQQLQQRGCKCESALDNQAVNRAFTGSSQLKDRCAAQGSAHKYERAIKIILQ